jgi:glycosyltransferase involved in cell wall biosynthesis
MLPDLVTTIIPVYNRASMLREAVASVIAQTHRPIEIVIVDDGSTDAATPATIADLTRQHREIVATRIENGGAGLAREAGRLLANGEFIQYLDSDDLLLPRKFELQVRALRDHPECGIAYGITRYRNTAGEEIACSWKDANQTAAEIFPSFLISRWWDTLTPLYRRTVTDAIGPWSALRVEEDWEYDARAGALGVKLVGVGEVVCEVRSHDEGRLSGGAAIDAARLRDRAGAHERIAAHALRAEVPRQAPEMQHFARELFLLARQCGAAGLATESKSLLGVARSLTPAWDVRIYGALAGIIGWRTAGRLAVLADKVRR